MQKWAWVSLPKLIKALMTRRHFRRILKIMQKFGSCICKEHRKPTPKIFLTLFLKVSCKDQTANQEHLHDELFHEQLPRTGENLPKQMGRQCVIKIVLNFQQWQKAFFTRQRNDMEGCWECSLQLHKNTRRDILSGYQSWMRKKLKRKALFELAL